MEREVFYNQLEELSQWVISNFPFTNVCIGSESLEKVCEHLHLHLHLRLLLTNLSVCTIPTLHANKEPASNNPRKNRLP